MVTKTSDKYVKLCRKLRKRATVYAPFCDCYLTDGDNRTYTNGHVLLSDTDNVDGFKYIDIKTLRIIEPIKYGNIRNILNEVVGYREYIKFPEEFYPLLKVFNMENKATQERTHVVIENGELKVTDIIDGTILTYSNVDTDIRRTFKFDIAYMKALKPKKLLVSSTSTIHMGNVVGSYDKVVDSINNVLLAGIL